MTGPLDGANPRTHTGTSGDANLLEVPAHESINQTQKNNSTNLRRGKKAAVARAAPYPKGKARSAPGKKDLTAYHPRQLHQGIFVTKESVLLEVTSDHHPHLFRNVKPKYPAHDVLDSKSCVFVEYDDKMAYRPHDPSNPQPRRRGGMQGKADPRDVPPITTTTRRQLASVVTASLPPEAETHTASRTRF
jgi:hypothetical protein